MKNILFVLMVIIAGTIVAFAQKAETLDIITYRTPSGWQKEVNQNAVQFGTEDGSGGICLITLFKPTPGSNDPKVNFSAAWETIVKELVTVKAAPQMQPSASENGWTAENGFAEYESDGKKGLVLLVTITGGGKMVNVLILTNTTAFQTQISEFLESISLPKVESRPPVTDAGAGTVVDNPPANTSSGGGFQTTNFQDGWVSVAREDWVEVTKGQVKVLLHYPKQGTVIAADPEPATVAAWNILVAPRYSNLRGFKVVYTLDYQRPYLGAGMLTDNQTGREVFVSLFRKTGGWVEIVTPDKDTFAQNFGFDINNVRWDSDSAIWNPLTKLEGYNKFAISTSDFDGEWTDRFASNTFYTNIYTGMSAGMSTYTSSETFVFSGSKNYRWNVVMANSYQGSTKFAQGKSAGTFKVLNDWQLYFSDIEGKPKTYNAYFSYIKGSKVLWMIDAQYPGSGIYTGYARKTN